MNDQLLNSDKATDKNEAFSKSNLGALAGELMTDRSWQIQQNREANACVQGNDGFITCGPIVGYERPGDHGVSGASGGSGGIKPEHKGPESKLPEPNFPEYKHYDEKMDLGDIKKRN